MEKGVLSLSSERTGSSKARGEGSAVVFEPGWDSTPGPLLGRPRWVMLGKLPQLSGLPCPNCESGHSARAFPKALLPWHSVILLNLSDLSHVDQYAW